MGENRISRLSYIDRVKGFAMCAVVLGHILTLVHFVKPNLPLGPMIKFLSVFEMAIFFVVSGYLFHKHHEPVFCVFLKKKARGLLIPYFVFSLLNILFFLFIEPAEQMTLSNMSVITFTFYGISVLWFFPTLFIGEVIWWVLHKKLKPGFEMLAAAVLMLAVSILHTSMQPADGGIWTSSVLFVILNKVLIVLMRGIVCLFFIGIGHCMGCAEEKWKMQKTWDIIMWLSLLVGLILAYFVPSVNLRDLSWDKTGLWCLSASMISAGFIFFFRKTANMPLRILELIGKNSLIIMCTHLDFKIPVYCMMYAEELVAISPRAKDYVYWGTLFFTLILFEGILIVSWNFIRKKTAHCFRQKPLRKCPF